MDTRAPTTSLSLHKETRISLEPLPNNIIIQLQLPSTNAFGRTTRVTRKVLSASSVCQSDHEFKKRHIASYSSVFFRQSMRYPRSILWRCLEGNTVLELGSVDLDRGKAESKEALLIIRFIFPHAIRSGGIALADGVDEDLLSIFVMTKGNDLYTFDLKSTFFSSPSASEDDFDRWCKTFRPSSLTISNSHKLVASNSHELLISLGDGRLARLTRKKGQDGTQWSEAAYNDGQWGASLRGLIRWQGNNSVRFEGSSLDQLTSVAVCTAPDLQHIFAIGLNHTLRAWNISNGRQTFSRDLLDIPREPHDAAKLMLNPAIAAPLHLFTSHSSGGYKYFAVTFSPLSSGLFKFWGIRDADHDESGVRDLFPEDALRLPDPDDEALWTLADFGLRASPETAEIGLWILLRLNRRYKLYHRKFHELQNIGEDWEFGWSTVAIDSVRQEPLNQPPIVMCEYDSEDINSKWLRYLLAPGRIPTTVLEAAIATYAQTRDISISKSSRLTMEEKLSTVIGSRTRLQQQSHSISGQHSMLKFRQDILAEWSNFWNIVQDLDQYRWEPMSLALDAERDMPWIVLSDGLSAIRSCCEVEILADNKPSDLFSNPRALVPSIEDERISLVKQPLDDLARLLEAAAKFRASFSEQLLHSCDNRLLEELWSSPSTSIPNRIQIFYDQCDFVTEINDRQYNELASSLKEVGGFDGLNNESIQAIVGHMTADQTISSGNLSTHFWLKVLTRGAQDMLAVQSRILEDLVFLTVFVEVEVDRDEHPMPDFDAVNVFDSLITRLKQTRLSVWLANSPHQNSGSVDSTSANTVNKITENSKRSTSTALYSLFAKHIQLQSYQTQSQSLALTNSIRDLLVFTCGEKQQPLDKVLVSIQCQLLRAHDYDLATEFQIFQPSDAWATYIRGRLCLLKQDYTDGSLYLKRAAHGMSRSLPSADDYIQQSFHFIDGVNGLALASGLSSYYAHVASLFSSLRCHSEVVTFARLALQHHTSSSSLDQRSDLLSQLFSASVNISDYVTAYSALIRYTDRAIQRADLTKLVDDMANADAIDELLRFPFPTLQKDVDTLLVKKSRAEAQSQISSGRSTPFFKILYAWRLRQGDLRGAAAVLVERLELKGRKKGGIGKLGAQKEAENALDEYLVGINALALVGGEEDGWVFVDSEEGKRKVVRLADLRETYEKEMDRASMVELGRFGIVGDDDDEDIDMNG